MLVVSIHYTVKPKLDIVKLNGVIEELMDELGLTKRIEDALHLQMDGWGQQEQVFGYQEEITEIDQRIIHKVVEIACKNNDTAGWCVILCEDCGCKIDDTTFKCGTEGCD